MTKTLMALIITLSTGLAFAADSDGEKRLGEMLSASATLVGEAVWLDAGADKFLGLYTGQTARTPQGGAIILHDAGMHPDWPAVVAPLRRELPKYGWSTLAVQLPLPGESKEEDSARLDQIPARIRAAIAFLRTKDITRIVLIGHGQGATLGATFLANDPQSGIGALIGVGMSAEKTQTPRLYLPTSLEKISLPVLDIYGGRDEDSSRTKAERRNAAVRARANASPQQTEPPAKRPANALPYRQIEIPGTDHFFTGSELILTKRISGWLKKNAATAQPSPQPEKPKE